MGNEVAQFTHLVPDGAKGIGVEHGLSSTSHVNEDANSNGLALGEAVHQLENPWLNLGGMGVANKFGWDQYFFSELFIHPLTGVDGTPGQIISNSAYTDVDNPSGWIHHGHSLGAENNVTVIQKYGFNLYSLTMKALRPTLASSSVPRCFDGVTDPIHTDALDLTQAFWVDNDFNNPSSNLQSDYSFTGAIAIVRIVPQTLDRVDDGAKGNIHYPVAPSMWCFGNTFHSGFSVGYGGACHAASNAVDPNYFNWNIPSGTSMTSRGLFSSDLTNTRRGDRFVGHAPSAGPALVRLEGKNSNMNADGVWVGVNANEQYREGDPVFRATWAAATLSETYAPGHDFSMFSSNSSSKGTPLLGMGVRGTSWESNDVGEQGILDHLHGIHPYTWEPINYAASQDLRDDDTAGDPGTFIHKHSSSANMPGALDYLEMPGAPTDLEGLHTYGGLANFMTKDGADGSGNRVFKEYDFFEDRPYWLITKAPYWLGWSKRLSTQVFTTVVKPRQTVNGKQYVQKVRINLKWVKEYHSGHHPVGDNANDFVPGLWAVADTSGSATSGALAPVPVTSVQQIATDNGGLLTYGNETNVSIKEDVLMPAILSLGLPDNYFRDGLEDVLTGESSPYMTNVAAAGQVKWHPQASRWRSSGYAYQAPLDSPGRPHAEHDFDPGIMTFGVRVFIRKAVDGSLKEIGQWLAHSISDQEMDGGAATAAADGDTPHIPYLGHIGQQFNHATTALVEGVTPATPENSLNWPDNGALAFGKTAKNGVGLAGGGGHFDETNYGMRMFFHDGRADDWSPNSPTVANELPNPRSANVHTVWNNGTADVGAASNASARAHSYGGAGGLSGAGLHGGHLVECPWVSSGSVDGNNNFLDNGFVDVPVSMRRGPNDAVPVLDPGDTIELRWYYLASPINYMRFDVRINNISVEYTGDDPMDPAW